jgi:hypothetical protein
MVPNSGRNTKLNALAFRLGTMAARDWVSRDEVTSALFEAAIACRLVADDGEAGVRATIESGLSSGERTPHPDLDDDSGVSVEDFHAYMPSHSYIFTPSREMWPASSVNARIPPVPVGNDGKTMPANAWLDRNKPVEQMTWAPGLPMLIENRLVAEGGWIQRDGVSCFNLYRPPAIKLGDATKATHWIDLVRKVYPNDCEEIFNYCAHRRQCPEDKINHSMILGGAPGIGKDTMLEALKQAVGPWNFREVSPQDVMGGWNDFMKSVVLRISEARDLGDVNRYSFYEHTKTITAAPPDVARINVKYIPQHYALNVCGVIYTTNHKTDGLYLPADDRRTYVAWSELTKHDFAEGFWIKFWHWYRREDGFEHVAAYLVERDISGFDPKAPPNIDGLFCPRQGGPFQPLRRRILRIFRGPFPSIWHRSGLHPIPDRSSYRILQLASAQA